MRPTRSAGSEVSTSIHSTSRLKSSRMFKVRKARPDRRPADSESRRLCPKREAHRPKRLRSPVPAPEWSGPTALATCADRDSSDDVALGFHSRYIPGTTLCSCTAEFPNIRMTSDRQAQSLRQRGGLEQQSFQFVGDQFPFRSHATADHKHCRRPVVLVK